jgi:diguanylate cyclase (GGDEF)-like protein/PAS domain S-box-containing protein
MTNEAHSPAREPVIPVIDLDAEFAQQLLRAIDTVLIVVRPQGDIMVWNSAAERVFGWPGAQVLGRSLGELDMGILDGLVRRLAAAPAHVSTVEEQVLVRSADGRSVATVAHLSRVMPGDEGAGAVVIAMEDMTSRFEEEQRLRTTHDRLEMLVHYAADMVVLVDAGGTARFVSSAMAERAGFDVEEMKGKDAFEFVHPDDEPRTRAAIAGIIGQEHASCSVVFRVRAKDGEYLWMDGRAVNLLHHPSVLAVLVSLHDVTARMATESELAHQATHDPLTGLPNRTLFVDRLDHQVEHAQRHHTTVAVFFWDIDQFKSVNDVAGHLVGDQVLIEIADRAARALRTEDTVARLGGDEFVACAEVENDAQALALADRLLEALAVDVTFDGGRHLLVTPSIGLAYGTGARADRLLVQADRAMYDAKRVGGRAVSATRVPAD